MEKYNAAVANANAARRNQDGKGVSPASLPPRVVGICVGEGEAMRMLRGVDGVVCVGWKAGEELAKVVASCDIMVAPSEVRRAAVRVSQRLNSLSFFVCEGVLCLPPLCLSPLVVVDNPFRVKGGRGFVVGL